MRKQRTNLTVAPTSRRPVNRRNALPVGTEELRSIMLPDLVPDSLELAVFTDEEIRKMAEVKITSKSLLTTEAGLMSNQMGSYQDTVPCATCNLTNSQPVYSCPGHMGVIELNVPIIKPLFWKILFDTLESVCRDCYKPVLPEARLLELAQTYSGYDLLKAIATESKGKNCSMRSDQREPGTIRCGNNPKFRREDYPKNFQVMVEEEGFSRPEPMPIQQIQQILDNISVETASLLGFPAGSFHPRDLITNVLPVIPPCARPPNFVNGELQQDNLTQIYMDILTANQNISKYSANTPEGQAAIKRLNKEIYLLVDNSSGGKARRTGEKMKTFLDLIKGKQGIFRAGMLGKRADFTGRSVIGPNPSLEFGQVGVPKVVADEITIEDTVTAFDLELCEKWWNEGSIKSYQESESVQVEQNGQTETMIRMKPGFRKVDDDIRKTVRLKIGDKINRRLMNNDWVLINRNPSLHRHSMMAARVKIVDALTFQLPLTVTSPFNADFDGDEMNAHFIQYLPGRVEAAELLNMRRCIMGDQQNRPEMGLTFDALTTSAILTRPDTRISQELFQELMELASNLDKHTLSERLEKSGVTYRYQTMKIDLSTLTPRQVQNLLEQLIPLGTVSQIVNPPANLPFEIPSDLIVYSSGPFRMQVNISYPLNERAKATQAIIGSSNIPIEIKDEYSGRAAFSITIPAGFSYLRKGSQYNIYRYKGVNDELLEVLREVGVPHRTILVVDRLNQKSSGQLREKLTENPTEKLREKLTENPTEKLREKLTEEGFTVNGKGSRLEVNAEEEKPFPQELLNLPHRFEIEFTDKGLGQTVDLVLDYFSALNFEKRIAGEESVVVRNGILISGIISSKDVGISSNSMIHQMHNYFDRSMGEVTSRFLTDLPWIIDRWAANQGFTMGISDCLIPVSEQRRLQDLITQVRLEVASLGPPPSNPIENQIYETRIKQAVSRLEETGGRLQQQVFDRDNFLSFTSKGAALNFAQIAGSGGQQFKNSARVGLGKRRYLPYHDLDDFDLTARGFVTSNFTYGLRPSEVFYMMDAGREGLIDSAIKTATVGYFQRRLMKALENLSVQYDGSVRDTSGFVLQLIAGNDLLRPEELDTMDGVGYQDARYTFANIQRLADEVNNS